MKEKLYFGWMQGFIVLTVFLWFAPPAMAESFAHEFIGAKKCSICHKKPEQGDQYGIWLNSKHAKAIETLGTPEAKEAGAKLGVDDPQTSGKCLKCHSTAYGFSEEMVTSFVPVEEGVSCESCHGPGKDYMKKSVMEDQDAAIAAGLVIPNEATCQKCHNPESPSFKSFDFHESWEKIKHPVPKG
ncbi:MAG: cytochrome C554 [Candidatus Omnitrophica bacterium CG11_big_fil_rev_8_21_14_0_20_45_26]|uniref:Cytochrome C554 n=1 Tax=Candidatus Abzuiibacterium crystallinum TaxID=1974748 RepID=A0A2H0LRL6_9BACT|nr:MAG: cytochrome C554 [Candidatus Omnitrophica bacterium CG11_big_fil_rev_8_21_14_0_20_45_26]PIW65701.1 MAG: cytochrome C554 [Candidatus Omnitrophica bacterium CG12_big_fil_rev_8_21_14_0_65_45_16]